MVGKTAAERKRSERKRRIKAGEKRYEVWMNTQIQAIWEKIKRGEKLTHAEQTAWSNQWCTDYPTKR